MICPRKILAVGLALWLAAPAAALQQQEDPRARIRTTVELVVVPVTVKDALGKPVLDIRPSEFRVLEDGTEQQITLFSVEPFPLSAVILIDNNLKLRTAEQVESSLRAIAGGMSESDEAIVCRFDIQFRQQGSFTSDNDRLLTQLKRLALDKGYPGEAGGPMSAGPRINAGAGSPGVPARSTVILSNRSNDKNIDDAVYAAAQLLRGRERERRKIIFLISDGHNSRNNTNSFNDTLKALLSADISVYAVGVGDAQLSLGTGVLHKYARATGGDIFYAMRRADLEALYSAVTEQARNQYTLAYVPQKTDRSLEYHAIEVRVRRPGLTLLARDGYYVPPKP
ncbi:MAG: VWA domain-containing protein [Acidobacteria bacterium]|nr:VWA domain-containing protein [Acidobacteriota bacterium]